MIRHYDGSNEEQIVMQSKRGAIWALEWTPSRHRIFITKDAALKAQRHWKIWKMRQHWKQRGRYFEDPATGRQEACFISKIDPQTRKKVEHIR